MRAARLDSSMIERICYDDEQGTLGIWFRGGGRYVYESVPAALYEALKAARSAGACFNARIKGRYRCRHDPERRRFGPRRAA